MSRELERLTSRSVAAKREPGYYSDGGNLWLQVSDAGTKSWIFRYELRGQRHDMGLGALHTISLAKARAAASDCRGMLLNGINPLEQRREGNARRALESSRTKTFSECATEYIEAHRAGWINKKHADQWTNTLETYCGPVFGATAVQSIDSALVLKVLAPIWTTKHETATRLRARIENVLDWAASPARAYRAPGLNPARWKGHLDNELPKLKKKIRIQHHPALPFDEIGAFIRTLRERESESARALEFAILTAARTGEVIGAKPDEIDTMKAIWTIPGSRMKSGLEHRIPLAPRALELVCDRLSGDYIFAGAKDGEPLSNMAMLALLERMGRTDITVHGFRSTFRDWASETTSYPREVCEMALAHTIGNQAEAAYRRGDLFEKRKRLMLEWANFCERGEGAAKVIPIARKEISK